MKKVAILGFGTVGSGVYEMLLQNAETIEKACGEAVSVKYVLDIRDFSDREDARIFIKDFNVILEDPQIDIVAEVIGGIHPAYDFTKAALMAGKSVVTSNKELVATMGCELLALAKEKNVNYMFEASVGGGIPVISPLHNNLSANEIMEIGGILNGTTNYILTEMFAKGRSFEEALAEAQALGYAERNPASDVEGTDACRKIAILMSLISGVYVDPMRVPTEGITKIEKKDVLYAEALGGVIKLIGYGKKTEEGIYAAVAPSVLSSESPFSAVCGVFNAVRAKGNAVGDVMFYGRGAGKMPTASAVVSDICEIARCTANKGYFWKKEENDPILPYEKAEESYFVRVCGNDKDSVTRLFGDVRFVSVHENDDEFAFISPVMKNEDFASLAKEIPVIKKIRIDGGAL